MAERSKTWTAVDDEGNSITYRNGEVKGATVDGKTYGESPVNAVKASARIMKDKK